MLYEKLNCRGFVRFHSIFNGNGFYFPEVNTVPGLTSASIVPKMARAHGWSFKQLITILIKETVNLKLLFATNNPHKLREIREIMGDGFHILSLNDVHLDIEIPETQKTIEGNAVQKARYIHERTGLNCFADDTALEIEVLNGRPGVYSARYAGEGCSFDDNVDKILQELSGIANRKACFRCVICLIVNGKEHLFEGRVDGVITSLRKGNDGFGYDPVFLPDGFNQTFAEMAAYLKNGISHRGKAAEKIRKAVKKWLNGQVD